MPCFQTVQNIFASVGSPCLAHDPRLPAARQFQCLLSSACFPALSTSYTSVFTLSTRLRFSRAFSFRTSYTSVPAFTTSFSLVPTLGELVRCLLHFCFELWLTRNAYDLLLFWFGISVECRSGTHPVNMKTPNFMSKLCCEAHLKLVRGAVSLQSALWFEDIPRTQPLGCHNGGNDL